MQTHFNKINAIIATTNDETVFYNSGFKYEEEEEEEDDHNSDDTTQSVLTNNIESINNKNVPRTFARKLKISTLSRGGNRNHTNNKNRKSSTGKKRSKYRSAVRVAAGQGYDAMMELYDVKEPGLIRKGMCADYIFPIIFF